jgi:hypothetical protein
VLAEVVGQITWVHPSSFSFVTLEIAKHRGPRDAVLLHQRRDRHAAAVFIPEGADLARG